MLAFEVSQNFLFSLKDEIKFYDLIPKNNFVHQLVFTSIMEFNQLSVAVDAFSLASTNAHIKMVIELPENNRTFLANQYSEKKKLSVKWKTKISTEYTKFPSLDHFIFDKVKINSML